MANACLRRGTSAALILKAMLFGAFCLVGTHHGMAQYAYHRMRPVNTVRRPGLRHSRWGPLPRKRRR